MVKDLPFVSVIIPTYHDWNNLKLCIGALKCQTYPEDCFEIVIVNNDPEDMPQAFDLTANCRLLSEAKPGSYAARNKGISGAAGEIFAFTDSDCIPYPDWIEQAVKILLEGAERIAGRIELIYKSERLTPAEIYEKIFAFDQKKNVRAGISVTANMITWKDNFKKTGFFNDSLMSGGDYEWGLRARNKGIRITYAPTAVVRHPARDKLLKLLEKERRVIGGAVDIERMGYRHKRLLGLFRELRPPLKSYIQLISGEKLSLSEKIMAGFVLTLIKLNRIYLRIRLLLS